MIAIRSLDPFSENQTNADSRDFVARNFEDRESRRPTDFGFDPLFFSNHTSAIIRANINRLIRKTWRTTKDSKRFNDPIDLYFEKKDLDFNTAAGPQAFGDSVVSKRHGVPAEADLRGSGSSSAWCSAHKGSAAAGRMFEDPGLLRFD